MQCRLTTDGCNLEKSPGNEKYTELRRKLFQTHLGIIKHGLRAKVGIAPLYKICG